MLLRGGRAAALSPTPTPTSIPVAASPLLRRCSAAPHQGTTGPRVGPFRPTPLAPLQRTPHHAAPAAAPLQATRQESFSYSSPAPSHFDMDSSDVPFLPSPEQQRAIDAVLQGRNLFLTGCAGTGKSATLKELRRTLMKKYGSKAKYGRRVAVVAMTGLAAVLVGGTTLHSLLKLGKLEQFRDFERMITDERVQELLYDLDTLILDEASMMSAELLQALDAYLTVVRKEAAVKLEKMDGRKRKKERYDRPFGGLQIILSGDFFQLPPIWNKFGMVELAAGRRGAPQRSDVSRNYLNLPFLNRGFMFEAPVFHYGGFETVELTQVFRQTDALFVERLNAVRRGTEDECRAAKRVLLEQCSRELDRQDGIAPTLLFAMNRQVDERNNQDLADLPGMQVTLTAVNKVHVTHEPPGTVYESLRSQGLLSSEAFSKFQESVTLANAEGESHEEALDMLPAGARQRAMELRRKWRGQAEERLWRECRSLFKDCQAAQEVQLKVDAQVMLVRNMNLDLRLANGSRGVVTGFEEWDESFERECLSLAKKCDVDCSGTMKAWLEDNRLVPEVRFTNNERLPVRPAVFTATVPGYGVCVRVQVRCRCL
ncbi:hypothetical protein PLESTF_000387500 [Pleodorina starrii]|nr:hypothetical protein PLESTF_000387500 [Pleodorina starrii]